MIESDDNSLLPSFSTIILKVCISTVDLKSGG